MDLQNYHEWIAERQRLLERINNIALEEIEGLYHIALA
jgi:hypothetical protein